MTGMKNKQEYEEELRMGKGGFTLPGESGYEELTLKMAGKWGADVIRDSDGTVLSDEITHAGYGIYSTICISEITMPGQRRIRTNYSRPSCAHRPRQQRVTP